MGDARIGNDDVGSARQAFEFARGGDDLVALRDVGRKRMVTFAPARQRVDEFVEFFAATGDETEYGAAAGEFAGHGFADPARSAGDEDVGHGGAPKKKRKTKRKRQADP